MRDFLKDALAGVDGFAELRWHAKTFRDVQVNNGRLDSSTVRRRDGIAVRVLHQGTWGFASTSDLSLAAVRQALDEARAGARATASLRSERVPDLPAVAFGRGEFDQPGVAEVLARSMDERVAMVVDLEAFARAQSRQLSSTRAMYREIIEEKAIVTSDGADCAFRLVRPELYVFATAQRDGQLQTVSQSMGATGGWSCVFDRDPRAMAIRAVHTAVDLLSAPAPEGGKAVVVMAPSIVGLLVHEAIGHTVEADFVQAGSAARGRLGEQVASEKVTLCDSGVSEHAPWAGGTIPVDDEGEPDLEALEDYPRWCECAHDEAERALLRRLNDERNPHLARAIAELHLRGRRVFAAVGALHMTGPQALPRLLQAQGFSVERVVFGR